MEICSKLFVLVIEISEPILLQQLAASLSRFLRA